MTFTVPAGSITANDDLSSAIAKQSTAIDVLANDIGSCGALQDATVRLLDKKGNPVTEIRNRDGHWQVIDNVIHLNKANASRSLATIDYVVDNGQHSDKATVTLSVSKAPKKR